MFFIHSLDAKCGQAFWIFKSEISVSTSGGDRNDNNNFQFYAYIQFFLSVFQHKVWSSPDKINQTLYALGKGQELAEFFQEEFNMTFHLPKLGKQSTCVFICK